MKLETVSLVTTLFLAGAFNTGYADTLTLRNGQKVDGTYVGGTTRQINFADRNGKTLTLAVGEIAGMTFSAPPPPPPPPKPTPQGAAPTTVPAGTMISVRLIDAIAVDAAKAGQTFRGSVDDPVMLGGNIVIPRGADVVLQATDVNQAGRFKGSDEISLKVNAISFAGKRFEVVTDAVTQKGGSEGKKTARRTLGVAGLGAAIGGAAGGGSGAAVGAAVGAGVGAAASAGGQHLTIPSESRLQFRLAAAVNIQ
jgi:hypothetical protein